MSSRTLNLTTINELDVPNIPAEIPMLDTVGMFIRRLMAQLTRPTTLNALRHGIETMIMAEDTLSDEPISPGSVALLVEQRECDPKAIIAMNTHYNTMDISNTSVLPYFGAMREYGQTLDFPHYDFFQLALKCTCMVNSRIGPLYSVPASMSEGEYREQDFLALIRQLTEVMAFTVEVDGYPHDVSCSPDGRVIVDGMPVLSLAELGGEVHKVVVSLYMPQQFH